MAASTVLAKAVGAEELKVHKPGYRGLKSSGMITLVGSVRAMTVSSSFSSSAGIVRAVTTPDATVVQPDATVVKRSKVELFKELINFLWFPLNEAALRTKNPCSKVSNKLYLVIDGLVDEFGIGALRLTTRQTFQSHGVLKKNLKTLVSTIITNMGFTFGTFGDLNRNVLAPTTPYTKKE